MKPCERTYSQSQSQPQLQSQPPLEAIAGPRAGHVFWPAPALAAMAETGRAKLLGLVLRYPELLPQAIIAVRKLREERQACDSME